MRNKNLIRKNWYFHEWKIFFLIEWAEFLHLRCLWVLDEFTLHPHVLDFVSALSSVINMMSCGRASKNKSLISNICAQHSFLVSTIFKILNYKKNCVLKIFTCLYVSVMISSRFIIKLIVIFIYNSLRFFYRKNFFYSKKYFLHGRWKN